MKKILLLLFSFTFPTNALGFTTTIPSGTTESNGNINTVTTQQVYGQADNFTIDGHQQVMSGGITHNTTVNTYGQQTIYSGGTSYNTNIMSQGLQVVAGKSYNSTAQTNSSINVNSGGTAYASTIDGGNISVLSGGTSSGTILNSGTERVTGSSIDTTINGGTQQINRYGKSQNAILQGGTQNIAIRGTATNTTINSGTQEVYGDSLDSTLNGGIMNVYSTGYAENTIINGGTMNVNSGGFSSQTVLQSGIQNIYGQDINGTITGGTQNVINGGIAEETIIQGGVQNIETTSKAFNNIILDNGVQQVASGGYSYRSQVSSGGTINASGGVYEANISYGGILNVINTGLSQDTTLKGGTMNVDSQASSQNTTVSDGTMNVYGTDTSASITGGIQNIQSGGSSTSATISSSGIQNIYSGATSSAAQINLGGKQFVFASGTAINSTINGGVQIVYGTAENTTVNSGLQEIRSGGIANSSQITQGGILTVEYGGIADSATLSGGTLRLQSGGTLTGLTSATNSIINISGDHTIPDMSLDNSLVNISRQPQYTNVTFSQLDGSGTFVMSSDLSAGLSDQIDISSGSGTFGLIINDYSGSSAPNKFKIISESSTAADNFYLVGGAVDVGAFQYKLLQEGDEWYLEHTTELSDGVYIAKNTFTALSSLFYSHLTPVYSRLHFQHRTLKHDNGLWIKGINRYVKQSYIDNSLISNDIYGSVIGFDYNFSLGSGYRIITGAYTGYTTSTQKFDTSGKGTGQTESIGLYSTLMNSDNWFLDLVGSRFSHHQKTTSYTPASTEVIGRFDTTGWQAAFALGKRFNLASSWFVEPFIGMDYMYIKGVSYRTNFNTLISADDADYLSNSFGLTGGKSFNINSDISLDIYAQAALSYDWDTKAYIEVADYSITEDLSSLHYEFNTGLNASFYDFGSGYVDIGVKFGQHIDIPWEINIGYQYDF